MSDGESMYYTELCGLLFNIKAMHKRAALDKVLNDDEKAVITAAIRDVEVSVQVAIQFVLTGGKHEVHDSDRHYGTAAGL